MNTSLRNSLNKIDSHKSLEHGDFVALLNGNSPQLRQSLAKKADIVRQRYFGNRIYIRGLIEFTNYCKNNCFYCGIRSGNPNLKRYRLSKEDILSCCEQGYKLGFRTFVLQGGEDPYYTDSRMADIVADIHQTYPDCAITLSLGERSRSGYQTLFDAGANRYLLRHETATPQHYRQLHPDTMSYDNRMHCLQTLKDIGYQTGCGFMVGSPYQTVEHLANDLMFIQTFQPHMVGIGPFIPHSDTPFAKKPPGILEDVLLLLSIIRLIHPQVLLPATTALGTISPTGREQGILAGANVVMPNLSPMEHRSQYSLYDNKICTGDESAQCIDCLAKRMKSVGFQITTSRGDYHDNPVDH